ncbi:MAG: hypothetical protein IPJ98_22655 [Bryobacterales bacterium]|nr:hypothetical protein [Bryobacterales bacterium]
MRSAALLPLLAFTLHAQPATPPLASPPDPKAIIQRAFSRQDDLFADARDYTYLRHQQMKKLDSRGNVTETETTDHEVTILYGEPYRKLIRKNGRDLSDSEARKEQRKMDDEIAKRGRDQEKRRREADKEREETRKALAEVADAFDWKLDGQEAINGRPAWIIRANPRPSYKPRSREAKVFAKMSGRLWVDQADSRMLKVDARVDDTISFGWFLFRIKPGFRFTFELTRLDTNAWLPRHGWLKGEAKIGGLKTYRVEMDTSFSNYRRFQSDSRIVSTSASQ